LTARESELRQSPQVVKSGPPVRWR